MVSYLFRMQSRVIATTMLYLLVFTGCNDGSSVVAPAPQGAVWVKESGTLSSGYLQTAWASPSGSVFLGSSDGAVIRFDGRTWMNAALPPLPQSIVDLWGFSDREIFAAGGFAYHFDGKTWTDERPPAGSGGIYGIWGASPDAMLGVGYGGTVCRRINGVWTREQSPTSRHLRRIWGARGDQVFAVGEFGRIVEFNGNSWRNIESNVDRTLRDIWGRGRNDIYAVGDGVITHFDGRSWVPVITNGMETFTGVWGDDEATYVAGSGGSIYVLEATGLRSVFRSNDTPFLAIAGTAHAGIVAAGYGGVTAVNQGRGWSTNEGDLNTTYVVAHMARDGTVFVTGYDRNGGFVRSRSAGGAWIDRAERPEGFELIWAADNDHAFGLGYHEIKRLTGTVWDVIPTPDVSFGRALFGFDDGYVVAAADSVVGWLDGTSWTTRIVDTGVRVSDLWGQSHDDLFATSFTGGLYHWNGIRWEEEQFGEGLFDISGTSNDDIWIIGQSKVYHFNGLYWSSQQLDFGWNWRDVLSLESNDAFMIGPAGIAHFDGRRWMLESTPVSPSLSAIASVPGSPVYAVGDHGAVLVLDR